MSASAHLDSGPSLDGPEDDDTTPGAASSPVVSRLARTTSVVVDDRDDRDDGPRTSPGASGGPIALSYVNRNILKAADIIASGNTKVMSGALVSTNIFGNRVDADHGPFSSPGAHYGFRTMFLAAFPPASSDDSEAKKRAFPNAVGGLSL